jgi:low affinity Fe/Cu permease
MSSLLTQRRIVRFWLPLAAMWLLMALEQPTLSAVIARLPEPKLNLAAYGLTFSMALIVESPIIMFLTLGTALARSRQAYAVLIRFTHVMAAGLTALHLVIVLTPLYAFILRDLVGAPEAVIEPSRVAFLLMAPWSAAIAYRRMWQGIMIRYGRTQVVFVTTAIRLATTALVALAGLRSGLLPGASLAGLAVSCGVLADAAAAGVLVRSTLRQHLAVDRTGDFVLTQPYLLRFYAPLAMTSLITLATTPIVSLGLSRGPLPLESLAIWPVIGGLLFLWRSTGVALQEVVVALLHDQDSYLALRRFAHTLALALSTIAAVVALTPLATVWFTRVAGLSPELAALARLPAALLVLVPALTALTSWQRGVLVHFSRTTKITIATTINIAVLLLVVLAGVQLFPWPGAITAALALTTSLACEVAYLTSQARNARRVLVWA